jgi:2,4-dienoyl-CoA reductase-like NADH-dependent reductase (Old Yellow Enzyme family)
MDMAEISSENIVWFFGSPYRPRGLNTDLSEAIKKSGRIRIPVFCHRLHPDPAQAEEIIASGKADGVSLSRALIADPYFPEKAQTPPLRRDHALPPLPELHRQRQPAPTSDMQRQPLIGREARLGFAENTAKARRSRRVLVAGGGPAACRRR